MSDVDILLYLSLLDQPLLGVRSLHESLRLFVQHDEHVGQCAGYVHSCVIFVSALLEKSELPTLVHS